MKVLNSFLAMQQEVLKMRLRELAAVEKALQVAARVVTKVAKSEIGHLQPEAGPFNAWAPLADATILDKQRKGYDFNGDHNPLLRTGALRDSIEWEFNKTALEVIIGSKSPIMLYQEFGTTKIPPRSVIGRAAFVSKEMIMAEVGYSVTLALKGKELEFSAVGKLSSLMSEA